MHIHIHYNYSIEVMRNKIKKKTLEEYYKIKADIKFVFLFLHNSKTKYISKTLTLNFIIYECNKTHKSTTSNLNITFSTKKKNLNIKIIIVVVTQYKMQAPLLWL